MDMRRSNLTNCKAEDTGASESAAVTEDKYWYYSLSAPALPSSHLV